MFKWLTLFKKKNQCISVCCGNLDRWYDYRCDLEKGHESTHIKYTRYGNREWKWSNTYLYEKD